MTTFTLELRDAYHSERIEGVASFVGEDASGSFGILAGHARFLTVLVFGLARFRVAGSADWRYLALPGGVLFFKKNTLYLSTRRYFVGDDYVRISTQLEARLVEEEQRLRTTKESLHRMEEALLRNLWRMGRT